jgi:hypothetical protein
LAFAKTSDMKGVEYMKDRSILGMWASDLLKRANQAAVTVFENGAIGAWWAGINTAIQGLLIRFRVGVAAVYLSLSALLVAEVGLNTVPETQGRNLLEAILALAYALPAMMVTISVILLLGWRCRDFTPTLVMIYLGRAAIRIALVILFYRVLDSAIQGAIGEIRQSGYSRELHKVLGNLISLGIGYGLVLGIVVIVVRLASLRVGSRIDRAPSWAIAVHRIAVPSGSWTRGG